MVIVLMGPAGAGRSTVGEALAGRLGWRFVDADDYHSAGNIAKMRRGLPLDDADRAGWLRDVHAIVARAVDRREHLVLACSALTRRHRAQIVDGLRTVRFVYLKVPGDVLRQRLEHRHGHFAKGDLLISQLHTLEEPGGEALTVDGTSDVDTIVGHIRIEFGV
jgi:gluconokinase